MTEFGDNMKSMMSGLNGDLSKREQLVKKEKKKTEYKYTFEVSGIDFIAHYFVSGKEKMTLAFFPSQTDGEGHPVCFIKEKDQNIIVDESSLKSFLNGLSHSDCFPEGEVQVRAADGTICESVPKLVKTNGDQRFIRCFMFMLRNKWFMEHVKMGIINLDIIYNIVDYREGRSGYGGGRFTTPWFFKTSQSYGMYLHEIEEVYSPKEERKLNYETNEWEIVKTDEPAGIDTENIHLKLFKKVMDLSMQHTEESKMKTLYQLYSNDGSERGRIGAKEISMGLFKAFLVIANKYDEPFAIKCVEDYMTNPKLSKLSARVLNDLFTIDVAAYSEGRGQFIGDQRRSYYNYNNYTTVSGDLTRKPLSEAMQTKALNLEKNRFWDYILQATCVGLGKNLENYIQLWTDYITSCLLYFGKVSDKYPDHLQEVHDIMIDKYSTYHSFNRDDQLKVRTVDAVKYCEMKNDEYQFHIFTEVKEFLDEATAQGNCLASADYAGKVADGKCWIGSFRRKDSDIPILTVEIDPKNGQMVQIKARYNHEPDLIHATVLKKFQDKIYSRMIKDGYIEEHPGYNYAFQPVLEKEKKEKAAA